MKFRLVIFTFSVAAVSCSKNFYGTYNTKNRLDKSAFYQIKLNSDQTVEKTEVHTISNSALGFFAKADKIITCYFDSSKFNYPPDTVKFKLEHNRLYFIERDGRVDRKNYLLKAR